MFSFVIAGLLFIGSIVFAAESPKETVAGGLGPTFKLHMGFGTAIVATGLMVLSGVFGVLQMKS